MSYRHPKIPYVYPKLSVKFLRGFSPSVLHYELICHLVPNLLQQMCNIEEILSVLRRSSYFGKGVKMIDHRGAQKLKLVICQEEFCC